MNNLLKSCFLAILINCFTINVIASSGSEHKESSQFGLHLEGIYNFYIEHLLESPFIFILPKGEYKVFRTSDNYKWSSLDTYSDEGNGDVRYKMHTGFLLHRKSDFYANCYVESKYVKEQIDKLLNNQMSTYKVFFYDEKYKISSNEYSAICEGNIFSPALNATGFYFLKRYMPIYEDRHSTNQACYLLFYSFELDYESAKAEFEKISSYVHCVYDGCVR